MNNIIDIFKNVKPNSTEADIVIAGLKGLISESVECFNDFSEVGKYDSFVALTEMVNGLLDILNKKGE